MKVEKLTQTPIPAVTKNIPEMDVKYSDCNETALEQRAEETEPERGNWTGRFDFLLSLLGYSVGLGNVWRFPYLCYNNGGGAFLIPFTVMLIIAGLPLMFMELSFGQYAALGPVAVYNKFCPLFRGLGYGMVIVSSIVMLYYNLIIAWTIYYMAVSFMSIFYHRLPWQNCDADWSTKYCYSYEEADVCESKNGTYYLRQCVNETYATLHNIAALAEVAIRKPPAEEYFTNQVLGLSAGIEEMGQIRWGMAVCLFAAWLIVFLCLFKGVQSSGKVVYFTALFPYVVLVILFFRGVTLPGASTGILYYLTPDFSQLLSAQVWGDAAVQIFFALSPAWGGLITLSSYNKFSNNCYIDSLIVAVSNIATSFFAGLVIFSVIGFLAHELQVDVDRVVDQGAGLAFIVYPEVVTRLPVSPLWSILFFLMLLTLGLDSQFALMETVTTAILDRFPNFRQRKGWVVFSVAVFGYLGGLIFTTNSGMYWLQLMDKYAANWSVLIIAIGECILIAWIYGAEKFCRDIQRMIGNQSKLWVFFWSAMWRVITPAALVFILVFNWIEYKPASYGHYVYPMWADAVGWTLGVLPVVVVVLMAIDQICSGPDELTIMEKARFLSRPTEEWGPAGPTSQDGGDSTSITSGIENEVKKSNMGIIKTKRNSIKRKVQNFSNESDDTVIEPLLQIDKKETMNRSAKYLLSKSKTDSLSENESNMYSDTQCEKPTVCTSIYPAGTITTNSNILRTPHNHMNTNVFGAQGVPTVKSSILVEINGCRPVIHSNQTSSIFTTAKIHADSITKNMEPIQVTPVPILSTVEGNVVKASVSYEYGQSNTVVSNMNSSTLKSTGYQGNKVQLPNTYASSTTSHAAHVVDGKSDFVRPLTGNALNKFESIDCRSISTTKVITTEIEPKSVNKPSDITTAKVTTSSTAKPKYDEKVTKISPPIQTVNKLADNETQSVTEKQSIEGIKNTIYTQPNKSQIKTVTNVMEDVSLPKQNTSNLKINTSKDYDVTGKTDKTISSTSSCSKQLQRQKNTIVEDLRDSDVHLKKTDKEIVKIDTDSLKFSKDKIGITREAAINQSTLSKRIMTSTSKDQLSQSINSQITNNVIEKTSPTSLSQVTKPAIANLSQIAVTTSQIPSLLTAHTTPTTASVTSDLALEKKVAVSLNETIESKEVAPKSIISLPTQTTASVKLNSVLKKELINSSGETSKPKIGISSAITTTTNKMTPKDTVNVQPIQSTTSLKLESEKKLTPSSNQISKSEKEHSNKQIPLKLVTTGEINLKTANTNGSMASNATQIQKIASTSQASSTIVTSCNAGIDLKTSIASEPNKSFEPQTTITSTPMISNVVMPTSTISVTKTEKISKSPAVVPSGTKSAAVVSKNETVTTSSVKLTSSATLTSTTTKATTLTKPSTSTSKANLSDKLGKK